MLLCAASGATELLMINVMKRMVPPGSVLVRCAFSLTWTSHALCRLGAGRCASASVRSVHCYSCKSALLPYWDALLTRQTPKGCVMGSKELSMQHKTLPMSCAAAVIGCASINPDGGSYPAWEAEVSQMIARWRQSFAHCGLAVSLQRTR